MHQKLELGVLIFRFNGLLNRSVLSDVKIRFGSRVRIRFGDIITPLMRKERVPMQICGIGIVICGNPVYVNSYC